MLSIWIKVPREMFSTQTFHMFSWDHTVLFWYVSGVLSIFMGPADYVLHIVIPLIFSCQEGCEVLSIGLQVCSEIAAQSDFLVDSIYNHFQIHGGGFKSEFEQISNDGQWRISLLSSRIWEVFQYTIHNNICNFLIYVMIHTHF